MDAKSISTYVGHKNCFVISASRTIRWKRFPLLRTRGFQSSGQAVSARRNIQSPDRRYHQYRCLDPAPDTRRRLIRSFLVQEKGAGQKGNCLTVRIQVSLKRILSHTPEHYVQNGTNGMTGSKENSLPAWKHAGREPFLFIIDAAVCLL